MKQILTLLAVSMASSAACADFFVDDSHLIEGNGPRLSYGVAVTDLDGNNVPEFIVTGFGYPNLALEFAGGRLSNRMSDDLFSDAGRKTIGVSACDVDGDGTFRGVITDAVFLLNFQFQGGPPPPAPFPDCGSGSLPSDTDLGCERLAASCR